MEDTGHIKSLIKAMSLIQCFSPTEPEFGVNDICNKLGLPKATVYRLLGTLIYGRFLEKNEETGKYRIGPVLYMLGSLYLSTTDILSAAQSVTRALNDITGEAVNMSIIDGAYSTIVLKEETKYRFRWGIHIGHSTLAYSSSMGKALLSELSDEEIDKLYPEENLKKITPKTVATKTELKLDLEKIRKTGFAYIVEGDIPGISGVATIIRDSKGKAAAAMSFSFPRFRVNKARRDILIKLIKKGASLVSYRLGYRDSNNPVCDIDELISWWEQYQSRSSERFAEDKIS